jgi:hypothetical protein
MALVVSEDIYWSIVRHEYDGIPESAFQPLVRITVAGRRRQGWVHIPVPRHTVERAAMQSVVSRPTSMIAA